MPNSTGLSRRRLLGAGAACTASVLLPACTRASSALDPTYKGELPGPSDVDGKLSRLIPGKRKPATYAMAAPSAVRGAAAPLVTIVEYSDFQCPFCSTAAAALHELVGAYPQPKPRGLPTNRASSGRCTKRCSWPSPRFRA